MSHREFDEILPSVSEHVIVLHVLATRGARSALDEMLFLETQRAKIAFESFWIALVVGFLVDFDVAFRFFRPRQVLGVNVNHTDVDVLNVLNFRHFAGQFYC